MVTAGAGTSTEPNEKMFEPRYLRTPSGMVSWSVSTANDGMAMITRMITGSAVHTTSSSVLWVKRDGTGFDLALKRTMMTISRSATSTEISTAVHSRMPSWKAWIESMMGVTES